MGRIAGWLLLALAAFMFVGYLGADVSGPAALVAFLIVVVLPAAGGVALIRGSSGGGALSARREQLRRDTLQSEVMRLAVQHQGRLTIIEVVSALAISPAEAKEVLDGLAVQGLADFEVTESGVVVYVFHDAKRLHEKHESKGLLE